jgi:DNA repair exonuclease SbcCD ATPase subunit
MIRFDTLKFKNFLNSGHQETIYVFRPGLTRIDGVSGVGKSTVIDAFYFAITGKAFRDDVKIDDLVNWTNGNNCRVELSFTKKEDRYNIVRTLKDEVENIFKIEKNGEILPIDKKKKTYQEQLYDILGIDEHYIEIGLIKSNLRDVSFLSLKKSARIEFGEKFFKMDLIGNLEEMIVDDLVDFKKKLQECERSVTETTQFRTTLVTKIDQLTKMIEETNKKALADKEQKLKELQTELEKNQKALPIVEKIIATNREITQKIDFIMDKISEHDRTKREIDTKLSLRENKKKIFEESCPECAKVDLLFSDSGTSDLKNQKSEIEKTVATILSEKQSLALTLEKNRELASKKPVIDSNLRRLNNEMTNIKAEIENLAKTAPEVDYTEVNELTTKLESLEVQREQLTVQTKIYSDLKKIMTPLKIFVIKRRLLFMNLKINEYMNRFKLPFSLIFDEKFEPKIYVGKKARPYHLLSMGQKRRVNLSLTFTFWDLCAELNHERFNVTFLDEIFDNVDTANVEIILEILNEKVKDDLEIVFISHNGNFNNQKTDRRVLVTNQGGFGRLEET